jgi:hypothetical protein
MSWSGTSTEKGSTEYGVAERSQARARERQR